ENSSEHRLKRNVLVYVNELRENIEKARDMAKKNEAISRARTKSLWDKNCTKGKQFESGSKVLILEPTDNTKLFSSWIGPKEVVRKVGESSYEVKLDEKSVKVFHVNQLRLWNDRTNFIASVVIKPDAATNFEDSFIPDIYDVSEDGPIDFNVEASLSKDERDRLLALLNEYADVFRASLGLTDLTTHTIQLTDTTPCVGPRYRMAECLKERFEEAINRLLAAGVLRECNSPYRSPIIALEKPDKSLRLVCNYKSLNAKTVEDSYEMTNPNDVLCKAAGNKFISKIDLKTAFWQIGLATPECEKYTAFSCHLGSFCFTRASMGL